MPRVMRVQAAQQGRTGMVYEPARHHQLSKREYSVLMHHMLDWQHGRKHSQTLAAFKQRSLVRIQICVALVGRHAVEFAFKSSTVWASKIMPPDTGSPPGRGKFVHLCQQNAAGKSYVIICQQYMQRWASTTACQG